MGLCLGSLKRVIVGDPTLSFCFLSLSNNEVNCVRRQSIEQMDFHRSYVLHNCANLHKYYYR